jgi:hypothetical protein
MAVLADGLVELPRLSMERNARFKKGTLLEALEQFITFLFFCIFPLLLFFALLTDSVKYIFHLWELPCLCSMMFGIVSTCFFFSGRKDV